MEKTDKIKNEKLIKVLSFAKGNKNSLIRYGLLALVVIVFSAATGGRLFSSYSIGSIISQLTPLMIMCVGMLFVFSHGNIDVAEGAVIAICALMSIEIINALGCSAGGIVLALVLNIAVCELLYVGSIIISIKFRILSTIASLAIMFTARGLVTYFVSRTLGSIRLDDSSILDLFKETWFMILVMFLVAVCGWFIFTYTRVGKYSKAIGDNALSAEQSGANVNGIKYICYAIAGFCVALSTMFYLARTGSVTQNFGSGREMDVMISLILGGMLLSGGSKTRMSAAIVGSLTYILLTNGLSQLGIPDMYVSLVKGLVFLIMIGFTLRRQGTIKALPR